MALTPEKIETYHPTHLAEIAEWIGQQYPRWDNHFIDQLNDLQGIGNVGVNAEQTLADAGKDVATSGTLTAAATAAQTAALDSVTSLMTMQGMAVSALEGARTTGFTVDEQFGVTDTLPADPETRKARQQLATEHANNIAHHVSNFQKAQQTVAQTLRTQGQTLQGHIQDMGSVQCFGPDENPYCVERKDDGSIFTFPGIYAQEGVWPDSAKMTPPSAHPSVSNSNGHVSMVDNKFKTGGGDPTEPPMPPVEAPGDGILIGTGGAASTQSGLGVEDTRLPAMPKQWPPAEPTPVISTPECGPAETARDTFDNVAATAAEATGALLFPLDGPATAMIPSVIALAKGAEVVATTSDTLIDCLERQ